MARWQEWASDTRTSRLHLLSTDMNELLDLLWSNLLACPGFLPFWLWRSFDMAGHDILLGLGGSVAAEDPEERGHRDDGGGAWEVKCCGMVYGVQAV
jgi:hypothetical protein